MDERLEHERREATRDDGPDEADQKINPAKPDSEIGAHPAGAIATTGEDARAEEPCPEALLGNEKQSEIAARMSRQQQRENEQEREGERDDQPDHGERQRT